LKTDIVIAYVVSHGWVSLAKYNLSKTNVLFVDIVLWVLSTGGLFFATKGAWEGLMGRSGPVTAGNATIFLDIASTVIGLGVLGDAVEPYVRRGKKNEVFCLLGRLSCCDDCAVAILVSSICCASYGTSRLTSHDP
jgi:hypothetical protein